MTDAIYTERLLLRPLRASDAEPICSQIADWEVMRWLSQPPWLQDAIDFIQSRPAQDLVTTSFAITREEALVGVIDLRVNPDSTRSQPVMDSASHRCNRSASTTGLSRPAQASLALRPVGSLGRPRRPLSQGSGPPVTRTSRLPATSSTDNRLGGTSLRWSSAPSRRTAIRR